jgi:Tfp pilus assembly protein PilZ
VSLSIERRKHHRFKYSAFITLDIRSPEKNNTGQLMDFSEGGLYFESNLPLQQKDRIDIWLTGHLPNFSDDSRLFFGVEIIWHQNLYGSRFSYGYGAAFSGGENSLMRNVAFVTTGNQLSSDCDLVTKKDSREHPRRSFHKSLSCVYQNRRFEGYIANISRGGAFIETQKQFSLGKIIRINVPHRRLRKPVRVKGWVVRSNHAGVGVKFDRRSGRERRSDLDRRTGLDRRRKDRKSFLTGLLLFLLT